MKHNIKLMLIQSAVSFAAQFSVRFLAQKASGGTHFSIRPTFVLFAVLSRAAIRVEGGSLISS